MASDNLAKFGVIFDLVKVNDALSSPSRRCISHLKSASSDVTLGEEGDATVPAAEVLHKAS